LLCDPNNEYISLTTIRCLYGKQNIEQLNIFNVFRRLFEISKIELLISEEDMKTQMSDECKRNIERIINKKLLIRRINITANNVVDEKVTKRELHYEQFDIFSNTEALEEHLKNQKAKQLEDINLQRIIINLKNKYGKNSILKAMNLQEGGTTIARNKQIGGHSA